MRKLVYLLTTTVLAAVLSAGTCRPISAPPDLKTFSAPEDYRALREPGPVRRHTTSRSGEDGFPALSKDGKTLFFATKNRSPHWEIYSRPTKGVLERQITQSPADDIFPALSPDGKTLAFVSDRSGHPDVYFLSYPPRGAKPSLMLPASRTSKVHPSWSPDGKRIVFSEMNARNRQWELAVFEMETRTISYPREGVGALFPAWCPVNGSNTIVFQRASNAGEMGFALWLVEADGTKLMRLFESDKYACVTPAWSPDGKTIAYATVGKSVEMEGVWDEADDVWAVDVDGTNNRRITFHEDPDWAPCFSPDGGSIYFVSTRGGFQNIWRIPYKYTPASFRFFQRDRDGKRSLPYQGTQLKNKEPAVPRYAVKY